MKRNIECLCPAVVAAVFSIFPMLMAHDVRAQSNFRSGSAPMVVTQPIDQTGEYGANVTFSVAANRDATGFDFQWQKNGTNLADYANVAGSKTPTLTLIGVAQSDAGAYSAIITNENGSITSSVANLTVNSIIAFHDDFESGDLRNWAPFPDATSLTNSTAQNHGAGGSHSAMLTSSFNQMYHNLGRKLSGRAKATFWMYDDGGTQSCYYGELRAYTGPGHTTYVRPGGLKQLLAIGCCTGGFETNNTGLLAGEIADTNRYQGRVWRGTDSGWFNLNGQSTPKRSVGWHKFEIDRLADGTTVNFYVDSTLGRTIRNADNMAFDCIAIGSTAMRKTNSQEILGNVWFDDVAVEAFPKTLDWQTLDSEGSGLFDWMRLRETGTDPAISSHMHITTAFKADGHTAKQALGNWATDSSAGIHALNERGYVDYTVTAPSDDAYRIEIEGREGIGADENVNLPLIISIDGEYLGRFFLPATTGSNALVHCFTPFITAGAHTVRVFWDGASPRHSLDVRGLRLQSLAGTDDKPGAPKIWVANRLRAESGVEFAPESSLVSPVCIEGRGQYLGMMDLSAGTSTADAKPVTIQPGAGHRWYADVPLSPAGPTHISVSHQNGGLSETGEITWQITDLLLANDMTVRKGDALLLGLVPNATGPHPLANSTTVNHASFDNVTITIAGVTNYFTDSSTPVPHRFDQAGTYKILGVLSGNRSAARQITVKVIEATLESPAAVVGTQRYWDCTNLPPEVVIEADPRLKIREGRSSPFGPNGRQFALKTDAAELRYVVARLGPGGPILASTPVRGFRIFNSKDTYLRLVRTLEDRSQLIEAAFILSPIYPDVGLDLKVMVSGVTFEDGTISKTLNIENFDSLGICRVRFIRAAGVETSVCHTTKAVQNGAIIGWPSTEQ